MKTFLGMKSLKNVTIAVFSFAVGTVSISIFETKTCRAFHGEKITEKKSNCVDVIGLQNRTPGTGKNNEQQVEVENWKYHNLCIKKEKKRQL